MNEQGRRLLVVGASGLVGAELVREAALRGMRVTGAARSVRGEATRTVDLVERVQVDELVGEVEPDVIAVVSAWPYVDGCEADPARSERENVGTVENVIAVARPTTKIVYFSTDHVFDGAKHAPYLESDAVHPLSVYARHKRRAEEALLARENTLVVRTAWVFGREIRRKNFVYQVIDAARSGTTLLVAPQAGAPTWTGFLCGATLDLVGRGLDGIVHLTGGEVLTKLAWAALIARELELASFDVRETTAASAGQVAPRPERVALASERHELRQPELGSILRALARRGSFV